MTNSILSAEESSNIQVVNFPIKSKAKKLLRINLDNNLKFDTHVESICQKENRKLNALAWIANYMELLKRPILLNAFFKVQFHYYPAIWVFHSRTLHNKINRLHERSLRIMYIAINFKVLKNFCMTLILSLSTITIYMPLLLKCTKLQLVCLQK